MSNNTPTLGSAPEVSAGVVILRNDPKKGWCFLTLRVYGKFDLPKGHVDFGDADLKNPEGSVGQIMNAARREALQESGYILSFDADTDLSVNKRFARMTWGSDFKVCTSYDKAGRPKKDVYIFAAETLCPDYKIGVNEKGIKEHDDGIWVPIGKLEDCVLHKYLKSGVRWAIEKMRSSHAAQGDL
jgi:8-oxo-dGTP pyrophosphatase MutT (NUDIX family)